MGACMTSLILIAALLLSASPSDPLETLIADGNAAHQAVLSAQLASTADEKVAARRDVAKVRDEAGDHLTNALQAAAGRPALEKAVRDFYAALSLYLSADLGQSMSATAQARRLQQQMEARAATLRAEAGIQTP